MSEGNAVQRAFDRFGNQAEFEKRSGGWYCHGEEVIAVTDLQKSQYGPSYYLNQGFWLRQLGKQRYPREEECHIGLRLDSAQSEEFSGIEALLDLEEAIPDEQRVAAIVEMMNAKLLPLIERGCSISGLREMHEEGTLDGAAIMGPAYEVLGVEPKF